MDKNKVIKVVNRSTGRVGYTVPELNVRRQFASRESKEIPFKELEALSYLSGGLPLLKDYLVITDAEALKELGLDVEPEYYYTEDEVKELLLHGSLNEFLDCLDFAPEGVLELIKKLSVSLPLNDVSKRDAILEKMNFNVSRAIEIQNTKFDGDSTEKEAQNRTRRTAAPQSVKGPVRRTSPQQYRVVTK